MSQGYVHGYGEREGERLLDQATTLAELLYGDLRFPPGSRVLEAGCGVGAQTEFLARGSPGARFTCVDVSADSIARARQRADAAGLGNVAFERADLLRLPARLGVFDHVFVCFVLEHLSDPAAALASLNCALRLGGTLTVIEGDHGSAFFHPDDARACRAIELLIRLQSEEGGDANIGRRLRPLLEGAGFCDVSVAPRTVYADAGRPALVEGFTRNTFTAMVEGVRDAVLSRRLMTPEDWEAAIGALHSTAEPDGSFCYTFFRAAATRPSVPQPGTPQAPAGT
ncbi:MAG: methyltransferase domain-containing protein [Anaeromyxobacteraceae bacterium]